MTAGGYVSAAGGDGTSLTWPAWGDGCARKDGCIWQGVGDLKGPVFTATHSDARKIPTSHTRSASTSSRKLANALDVSPADLQRQPPEAI
jgi:hypothetical protein